MPTRVSRRLVIDASVARSAGGADAVFPLSKRCRDFLKTVVAVGHRAVLTRAVREEWKKHESGFARQWRTAMMARKKLLLDDPGEDGGLREAIEQAAVTPRQRDAMLKDAHLIEAAQATDRTVVSLDDTVRGLFGAAATPVRVLRTVVWVNPGHEDEGCAAWLERGAPAEKHRLLSTWRTPR
jgi:hypothetical protein